MKRSSTRIFAVILTLMMALQLSVFAADRPSPEQRAEYLTALGATSVQYALAEDGEILNSGQLSGFVAQEIDESTMYGVASISKLFTTAIVMNLVDDGVLALDEPVVSYIDDFEMADARYTDITVRMLLNHSSGLMGSTMPNALLWNDNDTVSHDTFLECLRSQRLIADPGAFSVYCNDGFSLAEILAERVTGKSYTSLLHEYITEPLGLDATKTPLDDFDRSLLSRTYSPYDLSTEMPNETINLIGAGGIYSTASELALFGQAFTKNGGILSEQSRLATMEHEYLRGRWVEADENIIGYGLGWDSVDLYPFSQYGITALCKGGDLSQFHGSLIVLPELGLSAAVLSAGLTSIECMSMASELLLDCLLEKGIIDEILPYPELIPAEQAALDIDVAPLAGYYASSSLSYKISFDDDGTMQLTLPAMGGMSAGSLIYIGGGRWADASGSAVLHFVEQQGSTYIIQQAVSGDPDLGYCVATAYFAQKLEDYTPSEDVIAAWAARDYMSYLCVSEKYTSMTYTYSLPILSFVLDQDNPGYMNSYMLSDENSMVSVVQIPVTGGRDCIDIEVFEQDGVEYVSYSGRAFMNTGAIPAIYSGSRSVCTIQPSGNVRWYYFGPEMSGKTVTVTCPESSGFAAYNMQGLCVNQSAVSGEYTFVADIYGMVAFIGDAGTVFNISVE